MKILRYITGNALRNRSRSIHKIQDVIDGPELKDDQEIV